MMKRVLLLIVAVMVVFVMVPSRVHANSKTITDNQGIEYTLDDRTMTASISGHTDALSAQIVIPATVSDSENIENTYAVTSIGQDAFSWTGLISVTFETESKLETIGNYAFYYCSGLNSITIPSGVTTIGNNAFDSTALSSITFETGSKLQTIGHSAFYCCDRLGSFTIPSGVTSIGFAAFQETGLTSITIPASVKSIEDDVFSRTALSSVTFEIGSKLEMIGNGAFYGCTNLSSITIPASVTSIGESAFDGTGLSSVTFGPESYLETIGHYAFYGCTNLSSIPIPSGVTSIGLYAFAGSRLTLIHYIGDDNAWKKISFGDYWMPDSSNPPVIHYVTNKTVKATLDKDGYNGYSCDETGCSEWKNEGTVISRPAKFMLNRTSYPYNGSAKKPAVTVKDADGKVITSDNYNVTYSNNINPGKATATVIFKGDSYDGRKDLNFAINKIANPLKVKAKTAKVKYKKLKKKAQKLEISKAIAFTKKGKGRMSYKLSSAKKGKKNFIKFFKIHSSTGKITIKKGLKKGAFKVTVKIKAAGNTYYKASAVKTVTFTITVK